MTNNKKVLLMILDGWGIAKEPSVSAIDKAQTPYIDSLYDKHANSKLITYGAGVGLPDGQMGNSEVGHMNLGAGRIVYQDFAKINLDIDQNKFKNLKNLKNPLKEVQENKKKLHLIGLVSDGGVHSHINHLEAILKLTGEMNLEKVFVHAFTDGRDVDPKSGKGFIERIEKHTQSNGATLASVIGRYYAMDRDKRWERTKKCYDLLVSGKGIKTSNISKSIKKSYENNISDEFIEPIVAVDKNNNPKAIIENGDVVIFFNFRTDRGRQLTEVLSQNDFLEKGMSKLDLEFITMTNYNESFKGIKKIYEKDNLNDTLGEVLSKNKKKQIRIAETEKYPHVTFFFNGGREKAYKGEKRILCQSPKVATYDLKPEMSAHEITDAIIPEIEKGDVDFICLNFANPDMVGHTGIMSAAIKACETVDICSKRIIEKAKNKDYSILVIADHGNSDVMINKDGSPNTAHTTNMVPLILIDNDIKKIRNGILGDIAPTILDIMNIEIPEKMTCKSLII
ncbi:MAG: 2,3-bisphosphoglycerate-independent phosphoglycerate mutase [Flavobacteriaceae bacterium]|nr:2,3-bisphosphoglycerate-independent phosphoglycerate mutase [Flavobacteriaceae bacterium]